LTFDEFGMWLHLGGSYWQRASFDAIVTVGALLALIVAAPALWHFNWRHWMWAGAILVTLGLFARWQPNAFKSWGHLCSD